MGNASYREAQINRSGSFEPLVKGSASLDRGHRASHREG